MNEATVRPILRTIVVVTMLIGITHVLSVLPLTIARGHDGGQISVACSRIAIGAFDPDGQTNAVVLRLGTREDTDPDASVVRLHDRGRSAVPLLIAELAVIDPEAWDPPDTWWHVVWCERALRSITGQRFEFRTAGPLPRGLAEFRSQEDPLGYVMEWMSHGRVFLAPRDVQQKVIEAWHHWYASNGSSFEIQPFESFGDWYY